MKILKIVAGIVLLLVAGVVVFLLTFDVGQYKGLIQDQAKAATGREVTIGDIKLALALNPAIVVSDVKVANASWGSRPDMLTLKRLEASTQLIPLLFGTVNISGLKLVEPDAVLETDAQGKGNWEFETQSASGGAVPLNISGITVEGLKLAYRNGQTRETSTVTAKRVEADIEGPLMDLNIPSIALEDVVASYKEGNASGEGAIGTLDLSTVGPIADINIAKLTLANAKGAFKNGPAAYEGAIESLAMEGEGKARAPAKGGAIDIAAALQALIVTKLTLDNATGSLKDSKTAASATLGKVTVDAKGRIADMGITNLAVSDSKASYKGEGAPVDAVIENLSLDDKGVLAFAGKVSGQDVKANGTLAPIAALVSMNKAFPAKVALEGFGLKADADIMLDMSKKRPSAKGSLSVPELDLSAYTNAAAAPAGTAKTPAGGRVFSDEPLPWGTLSSADADVKVSVGKLTLPNGLLLTDVVLPVVLADGKLTLKPATFAVVGGTVTADVAMDSTDKSLALKAEAKGFTAEALAKALKRTDLITQGPVDFNANVRGSGNSVRAIMATLDGSVIAGMGESKIRTDALNMIGGDVIMQVASAINPMGNKDPYTVARCAVVNLQITNGIANTNNGIAMVTDKMQVTSSGKIDFGAERIDLNVRPKATGGIGIGLGSLAQAVKVSGPLSNPGVGVDKAGAIKAIGTLGAAFATGGASLLAQSAKDKIDGGGDPCQTARTWHVKK